MKSRIQIYKEINTKTFLPKLLQFLKQENVFVILDSNAYKDKFSTFDFLCAWGIRAYFKETTELFDKLYKFHKVNKDWLFGHFSYDVKNYIEKLQSKNPDYIQFPEVFFFIPRYLVEIKDSFLIYNVFEEDVLNIDLLHKNILKLDYKKNTNHSKNLLFKKRMPKEEYFNKFQQIKKHIQLGDVYEFNFCQEFYLENVIIDSYDLFLSLKEKIPSPFSCLYRIEDKYLVCSSPERYLKKFGNTIISQPMKGTIKRSCDQSEDKKLYDLLRNSAKDISENVMIVDLVRNDLSRTAKKSTVEVLELCEVKSYPTVHQMISTIKSEINDGLPFTDVIKYSFPMGSMTGAPKIKAMELIDKYENTKRGLYSGTVGYITPSADFDFNVVIRSLQYNAKNKYASIITGGAITVYSEVENEYEECLLKAQGILSLLNATIDD